MTIVTTYGVSETNGLIDPAAYHEVERVREVDWTEPGLRVTRFRLVSDRGFPMWDVSYCHGQLPSGEQVVVRLPFFQLGKRTWRGEIIEHAKRDGVYAKGLGIFDAVSTLQ